MVTLFVGSDSYRRRMDRDRYLLSLVPESEWQSSVSTMDGSRMKISDLREAVDHISLFGPGPIVIIEQAEELDKEMERVIQGVANDEGAQVLLEYHSGSPSKAIAECGKTFLAKPMKADEAAEWLRVEWKSRKKGALRVEVSTYLVARIGSEESGRLWQEVSKIAEWAEGAELDIAAVEAAATSGRVRTPWAFYDATAEKRIPAALKELAALADNPEYPGVRLVMGLAGNFLGLAQARAGLDAKHSPARLREELGGWMGDKWVRQAQKWRMSDLDKAIEALALCDMSIKKGTSDLQALTLFVLESAAGRIV